MDKFWVVLRDPNQARSTYKQNIVTRTHLTEEEARDEAERLAMQESNRFFVMEAIASVGPVPQVEWANFEVNSD